MPDYRQQTDRIKDKLERAGKEDPYFLTSGASCHRYAIGPPLSERDVAAFEETHRASLPGGFRSFLTHVGNGSLVAARVIIGPEGFYPLSEQEIDAYEKNHGVSVGASERAFLAKVRNGLLRQFLPLTDDFNALTRRDLNKIARELNNRPRQTLNWRKPSEVFSQIVASTG